MQCAHTAAAALLALCACGVFGQSTTDVPRSGGDDVTLCFIFTDELCFAPQGQDFCVVRNAALGSLVQALYEDTDIPPDTLWVRSAACQRGKVCGAGACNMTFAIDSAAAPDAAARLESCSEDPGVCPHSEQIGLVHPETDIHKFLGSALMWFLVFLVVTLFIGGHCYWARRQRRKEKLRKLRAKSLRSEVEPLNAIELEVCRPIDPSAASENASPTLHHRLSLVSTLGPPPADDGPAAKPTAEEDEETPAPDAHTDPSKAPQIATMSPDSSPSARVATRSLRAGARRHTIAGSLAAAASRSVSPASDISRTTSLSRVSPFNSARPCESTTSDTPALTRRPRSVILRSRASVSGGLVGSTFMGSGLFRTNSLTHDMPASQTLRM